MKNFKPVPSQKGRRKEMKKLKVCVLVCVSALLLSPIFTFGNAAPADMNTEMTTEASVTTATTVTKVKIKYKKKMEIGDTQKIKVKKVLPKKAVCKKIKIVNKTKKILSLKGRKIKAKKAGNGKLLIKSVDGGYKKIIKIKIKAPSFQGVTLQYNKAYNITSNKLTTSKGVVYYNGHKETYYSQKVLPGTGLKIPGRHVAEDGTIRDKDGYIVVSTNLSFRSRYSTFMTSLGPAKVYDTGCAYGVVDIYVNW